MRDNHGVWGACVFSLELVKHAIEDSKAEGKHGGVVIVSTTHNQNDVPLICSTDQLTLVSNNPGGTPSMSARNQSSVDHTDPSVQQSQCVQAFQWSRV